MRDGGADIDAAQNNNQESIRKSTGESMYTVKGKADKNSLLTEHMPLVKRLAHHMKAKLPPSVEVDDLIQAGMIGLLDAINRYEDNHGAQFETYAVLRIRGAMLDELRSSDWMPRSTRQNMRKVEGDLD